MATIPDREARRVAALACYSVMDTPREAAFDEIAQLVAEICDVPIAVVNFIDSERQFFKAEVGLGIDTVPLEMSFCVHALLIEDFLLVPDTRQDDRFVGHPLVIGDPHIRFYAGALLKTAEGLPIGTLCVLDYRPRTLSEMQIRTISVLARQVMAQLDQRLALRSTASAEARQRAIMDSAIDFAIVATDLAGDVVEWSRGAERVLGWTEAEVIGRSASLFFTGEDRAAGVPEREMAATRGEGRANGERWHVRKSGERFWASGEMSPLNDGDGRHIGYVKILRDRTEQHIAGQALEDAERNLRWAQKAGGIGVFHVGLDGILHATPEFCRLYGVAESAFVPARQIEDLVLAEDRGLISDERNRSAGTAPLDVEYRIRHGATGEVRWIARRGEIRRDEAGKPISFAGVAQDITDRRQARDALAHSEERYRALFEAIDDGFCIIEFFDGPHGPLSDYVHVEANPGYERQTGISGVAGMTLRELAPDEADGWINLYGAVLRTGEPIRFERYFDLAGRHIEVSAARVEPASRRQVSVLFRDVEERRVVEAERDRAAAELRALNETLEQRIAERTQELMNVEDALRQSQKMDAVGQLTGGIAHDFNNMLTGVIGSLDLVQRHIASGRMDRVDRYIDAANTSAQRAAALTARLLAFGRRQSLDLKPTALNVLVGSMEDLLHRTLGEQIGVETHLATNLWAASTDTNQLENALLNLCINARDAMPAGGKLTIETANTCLDDSYAREHADLEPGDYVVLSVSDTGAGMSAATIEKVFEPFFTTKPVGQGTGLGLSMVYGFVKQSGGHVRIYSELGRGTTVKLYMPRFDGEVQAATSQSIEIPLGSGEAVIVVEDDPSVRMIVLDVLEELGYDAIEAIDAPSALPILQSGRPIDLMITDVGLPGMNGRQLAEIARQSRPDLKILFITGYAQNAAVRSGFLDEGMDMMTKPFAIDALATKVREILGR